MENSDFGPYAHARIALHILELDALYASVYTPWQTVSNRLQELRKVAARHGWEIVQEYKGQGRLRG